MGFVIINGTTFLIAADAPVVTIPTPAIPAFPLVVSSAGKFTALTQPVALKSDMEGQTPGAPVGYTNGAYTIPGTILWDAILSGSAECAKLTKDGSGLIDGDTNSGTVNFDVVVPAQQPGTPPTPDPNTSYPGTWTIVAIGQAVLKGV
jgi:hypothetical protein